MDEIGDGWTTETDMVVDALRHPFIREAIELVTELPTSDVEAAIDDLTAERVEWFNPHAVEAVARILNRTRGEEEPIGTHDRLEAREALEDASRATLVRSV